MGRKKRRSQAVTAPIFCYYCERNFATEATLLSHQKEKHLRCPTCNKRMISISGLVIHSQQVHNVTVDKVPNAILGKTDTSVDVVGMSGIPSEERANKQSRLGAYNNRHNNTQYHYHHHRPHPQQSHYPHQQPYQYHHANHAVAPHYNQSAHTYPPAAYTASVPIPIYSPHPRQSHLSNNIPYTRHAQYTATPVAAPTAPSPTANVVTSPTVPATFGVVAPVAAASPSAAKIASPTPVAAKVDAQPSGPSTNPVAPSGKITIAAAPATSTGETKKKSSKQVMVVFDSLDYSPEELRAMLPRYKLAN